MYTFNNTDKNEPLKEKTKLDEKQSSGEILDNHATLNKLVSADTKMAPASFNSAFASTITANADAPVASPFKSVFGAPATANADAPVASPFKSVFGAPATADTKAPVA
ncbi:uncharacterized protein TM35_000241040, partial [Trypanosoma theileri]